MNTKNNLRFQETEERIIAVFTELLQSKELDRVSVSEICQKSGISRSSFYLHFTDVYDMMDKIEERLAVYFGRLFSEPEENYDLGERFLRMFEFIREHQDFYRAYLSQKSQFHVLEGILPASAGASLQALAGQLGFQAHELRYHQTFFKAGLTALIREWLIGGCRESPEDLTRILGQEYSPDRKLFAHTERSST